MTPKAKDRFVVRMFEPGRALVLGDADGSMSWAVVLEPVDGTGTRLITRSRGAYDRLALGLMLKVLWHPLDFGCNDGSYSTSSDSWRRQHDRASATNILA